MPPGGALCLPLAKFWIHFYELKKEEGRSFNDVFYSQKMSPSLVCSLPPLGFYSNYEPGLAKFLNIFCISLEISGILKFTRRWQPCLQPPILPLSKLLVLRWPDIMNTYTYIKQSAKNKYFGIKQICAHATSWSSKLH